MTTDLTEPVVLNRPDLYAEGGPRAAREIRKRYPGLRPWVWRRLPAPPGLERRWPYKGERFIEMAFDLHHSVMVAEFSSTWGEMIHLQIRRHDAKPTLPWSTLQRIKDGVVGPERCAIHVHPTASDLVDAVNAYHLWVLPIGYRLPFSIRGDSQ